MKFRKNLWKEPTKKLNGVYGRNVKIYGQNWEWIRKEHTNEIGRNIWNLTQRLCSELEFMEETGIQIRRK